MISYFIAAGLLTIGLSIVRIAAPEKTAGALEVGFYRAAWLWFIVLTLLHINLLAALIYGLLLPWIGRTAIAAFPPQWFAAKQRLLGWWLVAAGAIALLLVTMYAQW